ncbi:MAG: phosphoenolpyruvate synthase, partial [Rothia mucilaginosa]|nr:phosphoenolpyruvate synthase [Rothia mucilaginosa]
MSTNISRRKVVAGAAWAAPVVAASAAVPAFASSTVCDWESTAAYTADGNASGAKGTTSFVVPALVDKIKFEVVGGAGGTNYDDIAAGSGAKITGIIEVKEGQTVQLIGAAGGIGNGPLSSAEGGEGYGTAVPPTCPPPSPQALC